MGSLDKMHKLFLQSMMSRAVVTKKNAATIIKQCAELVGYSYEAAPGELSQLFIEINSKIGKFGMEIKEIRAEVNMEEFVALVNIVDHSNIYEKLNHLYTVKEREIFRRILEMIITNSDAYGTVNTIDCLNMPGYRAGEIEELLKRFVSDLWFYNTAEGALCPAPRCIAEFEVYFKANYRDHIALCPLCSNVVFYGAACETCEAITHKFCIIRYNKDRENHKCTCGAEFPKDTISNEDLEFANPQPRKKNKVQNGHAQMQVDNSDATPGTSRRASKRHRE